jgi:hypothetical protein
VGHLLCIHALAERSGLRYRIVSEELWGRPGPVGVGYGQIRWPDPGDTSVTIRSPLGNYWVAPC